MNLSTKMPNAAPPADLINGGSRGRWAYLLVLLVVLHVLLDTQHTIAAFFPSRPVGYALLGVIYAAVALLLVLAKPSDDGFFSRVDAWTRATIHPPFKVRPARQLAVDCAVVVVLTTAACVLRWIHILHTPIDARLADMLPLIQKACQTLTAGSNPYATIYEMPWISRLAYWPGLWMPYLIPHTLGIDFRWVQVGAVIGIASLYGGFILRARHAPLQEQSTRLLAAFGGLLLFLYARHFILFANIAHTGPHWLWVSLLAVAIVLKRPRLSAVLLGVLLATRQPSALFVPFMVIYWLRKSNSALTVMKLCAITACVYLLICGPFLVLDWYDFLVTPLKAHLLVAESDFARGVSSSCANTLGLTFMLKSTHLNWLLPVFSVLSYLGLLLPALRRLRTETDALLYLAVTGIFFVLTALVPWHYEYFPSLILISFAAIAATEEQPARLTNEETL